MVIETQFVGGHLNGTVMCLDDSMTKYTVLGRTENGDFILPFVVRDYVKKEDGKFYFTSPDTD